MEALTQKKVPINDRKELRVSIDTAWCKGCGICIDLCPKGALTRDHKEKAVWAYPDKCIRCGLCEQRCPDLAVTLQKSEEEQV